MIQRALEIAYPNAAPDSWEVRDDRDGQGPRIVAWRLNTPRPTPTQLESALLLAAQEERIAAFGSNEQIRLERLFGSLAEFQTTAILDPQDSRLAQARQIRTDRKVQEAAIRRATTQEAIKAIKTPTEKERGK